MKVSTTSPSSGFLLAGCQPGGLIATRASPATRSVGASTSMPSRAFQSIRKEMSAGSTAIRPTSPTPDPSHASPRALVPVAATAACNLHQPLDGPRQVFQHRLVPIFDAQLRRGLGDGVQGSGGLGILNFE